MLWKKNALIQIIITVTAIAVLCFAVFAKVESTITTLLQRDLQHELNIIEDNFSHLLVTSQQNVLDIAVAPDVQAALATPNPSQQELGVLETYYKNWYDFHNIHLYPLQDGAPVFSVGEEARVAISHALAKNGSFHFAWTNSEEISCIQLSKVIFNCQNWSEIVGVIAVEIKPSNLSSLFASQTYSELYGIIDSNGKLCFSKSFIHSEILSLLDPRSKQSANVDYIVSSTSLDGTGWHLVSFVSSDMITQHNSQILGMILFIGGILVVFIIVVNFLTSAYMFRSIATLTKTVNEYTRNGCGADSLSDPKLQKEKGELGKLYHSFLFMAETIDNLIDQVYMAEIRKKDAELSALQAQINPHFLYNTLDSVNWLADKYGAKDIELMVTSLASMMRFSLNSGSNIITIENELKQIRGYLTIQTIRYNNAFDYEIDVPSSLYEKRIIKLLLQPLVENAIIHGYEDSNSHRGHIIIRAEEHDQRIVFSVINDGTEIDLNKVESLLRSAPYERTEGYGIKNVQSRLVTQYGADSGLHYSIQEGKTVVSFEIPK